MNIIGADGGPQLFLKSDGTLGWYVAGSVEQSSSIQTWNLNTWYHIGLSKNGGTITFYRNGVAIATNVETPYTSLDKVWCIGGDTASEVFPGRIDELGYWGRALTSTDMWNLYNNGNALAYPFTDEPPMAAGFKYMIDSSNKYVTNSGKMMFVS
jgi:hypothetical protein